MLWVFCLFIGLKCDTTNVLEYLVCDRPLHWHVTMAIKENKKTKTQNLFQHLAGLHLCPPPLVECAWSSYLSYHHVISVEVLSHMIIFEPVGIAQLCCVFGKP